ncbi:MAG: hypothetical protein JW892_06015 [Anaerolineae bacterium]|nr:hypothetical protein [Anaerolineae bacterium]
MPEGEHGRWWCELGTPWELGKLVQETLAYWNNQRPSTKASETERIGWYIQELLPQELYYATRKGWLEERLHCETLALLVGYSIEPLLQAISVYEPEHIVLLLHAEYAEGETGKQRGRRLATRIEELLAPRLTRRPKAIQPEVISKDKSLADKPGAVFGALAEHVLPHQRAGKRVVIDITGGKKSMDAGAFLFAAYADIPVSYVDFVEYNPAERRPWGYTCHVGELQNPYAAFRLRDWERVRQLYTDYHFRAAGDTLREVLKVMQEPAFTQDQIQATQRLLEILDLYEAWDDGDYYEANGKLSDIRRWTTDFVAPDAIPLLGPVWPDLKSVNHERDAFNLLVDASGIRSAPRVPSRTLFFESNDYLISYARDELARIARLNQPSEDARSALLRAAGLDELLLKARWSKLYKTDKLRQRSSSGAHITPDIYEQLLGHDNVKYMRENLRRGGLGVQIDRQQYVNVCRDPVAQRLADYEAGLPLTGEEVAQFRNQTIHQYIPIPESVAKAAYRLAEANLDDFVEHWATLDGQSLPAVNCVTRMEWGDVCRLCRLDFLPLWQKEQP